MVFLISAGTRSRGELTALEMLLQQIVSYVCICQNGKLTFGRAYTDCKEHLEGLEQGLEESADMNEPGQEKLRLELHPNPEVP